MKKLGNRWNKQMMRRVASAVLALVLFLGILPTSFLTTRAAHWTDEYIETLVDWGVMRGDVSGNMNAEKTITRAEFVAMVNRAFGYSADTTHPFVDVRVQDWFHNDIGMAYNMGYFKGTGVNTASPNSPLTREQAVVLIGRNLLLDEKLGEALGFSDSRTFGDWSRGMVESAISAGFIGGYDDGSFRPQKNVTRGEVAAMLVKAIGTMVNKPGTHELGGVYGNVMISTSGVKLKNTTIAGDLYITGGLELGDVLLENVNVLGKIVVSGAGESHKGDSSIVLRNVETGELVVDSIAGQFVTLRAEGNTQIDFTNVKTSGYLDDQTKVGDGLLYIEMNGEAGMNVSLAGNIEEVLNRTPESALMIAEGTAQIVTVDEKAVNSTLDIKNIASINKLNLDIGTPVTGEGDVKDLFVNAAGSVVDMLPDKIVIRPGLTAEINGEEMDTKEGNESSSEPRILSGYPKIKNLAPTSVEVVYSTNKKGTIHWALTSLIDGPVKVEDLLEVKDYNTKILQQGTINVTESNKEFRVKITNLLSDGSYYVSAVLVDSRDQKSPVKYITFTTPDGTPPAFASGYPELTLVTKNNAQVAVMPTKSSVLYYAVLPKGAAAPTVAEFKTGSISGDLGNCFKDGRKGVPVTKNVITLEMLTDEKLEELKGYELYLCLIDPDNGKDSGVKKLSFTTTDGTPPELTDAIPTGVQKNSVKLTTSMNEDGTIFWVAVKEDQKYPALPNGFDETKVDEVTKIAQLQIINGAGNVIKAGKVNAGANKDVVLNITGLEPESSYDIYYMAQDKAGNCSVIKMINQKTLDTSSPSARQEFTKTADAAGTEPLPETDIRVIFSETVHHENNTKSLVQMYEEYAELLEKDGVDPADIESARKDYVNELKKSVQLWDVSNTNASFMVENDPDGPAKLDNTGNVVTPAKVGTWINYERVEIEVQDNGEMVMLFRHGEAISLSSGSTYQFVMENLTDTATPANPMKPNPYKLDPFTTVFAQVNLTSRASGNMNVAGLPVLKGDKSDGNKTGDDYNRADVDMRFWMNPQSTDSVNSNVCYDIWLEAEDIIVYFDLYIRVIDLMKGTYVSKADAAANTNWADGFSMFSKESENTDDAGWMYLGNMKISASDGAARRSINDLINGGSTSGNAVSSLASLNDNYSYEFVIDVVQIGDIINENSWSEEVKLRVYVPAGQDLSDSDWAKADPWTNDIQNIGNPPEFYVSRKFIDMATPNFQDGTPAFAPGDAMANMSIALDRPGTLYYVVAPLVDNGLGGLTPSIVTTIKKGDDIVPFGDVKYIGTDVEDDGTGDDDDDDDDTATPANKPLGTDSEKGWFKWPYSPYGNEMGTPPSSGANIDSNEPMKGYTIVAPTSDGIALMVTQGTNIPDIQKGAVKVGTTRQTIKVDNLKPETTYLVYCILAGESQEYSNVYMFQFTTKQVNTPTIELNHLGGNTVQATTSEASYLSWALYTNTVAEKIFNGTFWDYVADKSGPGKTAFEDACESVTDEDPYDLTVLDALMLSMKNKQSIFDAFGNKFIKEYVLQRVTMEASSYDQPTELKKDLPYDKNVSQQIVPDEDIMSADVTYYIIAAARNQMGTDYGFKAQKGLRLQDQTAPTLLVPSTFLDGRAAELPDYTPGTPPPVSLYNVPMATVLKDNPENYMFTGTVEISFTERIYQLLVGSGSIESELILITSSNLKDKINVSGLKLNTSEPPYITVNGGTITFKFIDAQIGSSITIFKEGSICDGSENVVNQGAKLRLTLTTKREGNAKDGYTYLKPWFEVGWIKDAE